MNNLEFIDFFKAQLSDDSIEVTSDTVFREIPDWDSLTIMLLITNLKDDYSIDLSISDLIDCKTVADIHALILSK